MKSATLQNEPALPTLFEIAARFEDFAPTLPTAIKALGRMPFAEMMRRPEKLVVVLKAITSGSTQMPASKKNGFRAARPITESKLH